MCGAYLHFPSTSSWDAASLSSEYICMAWYLVKYRASNNSTLGGISMSDQSFLSPPLRISIMLLLLLNLPSVEVSVISLPLSPQS
jgi:hypothetical protein